MWAGKLKLDVYEYKNIFANLFRKLTLVKIAAAINNICSH
jgi:hypothetical protein